MLKFILAVEVCNFKCLTYNTWFLKDWKNKIKKNKYRKRSACVENIPKITNNWMIEVNGAATFKKILVRLRQKTLCDNDL